MDGTLSKSDLMFAVERGLFLLHTFDCTYFGFFRTSFDTRPEYCLHSQSWFMLKSPQTSGCRGIDAEEVLSRTLAQLRLLRLMALVYGWRRFA